MDLSYQHSQHQRILKQRNLLFAVTGALGLASIALLGVTLSRDREVVLQPVLRSPLTLSSAGVSRDYLEMITRDVVLLTLDRNPQNLEYWMESVLSLTAPRAQGRLKADLMKIVEEQRGSSIAQFFTIQSMTIDPDRLTSDVTGELHTIVGSKVVSRQPRTFRYRWEYAGLTLKLVGFGMVEEKKGKTS